MPKKQRERRRRGDGTVSIAKRDKSGKPILWKASISLGYDTSLIGKTKQNGRDAPGAVRITLGTLLLGGTYRFNEKVSLNVALGVGVTRDTPDMTLTARVPISF